MNLSWAFPLGVAAFAALLLPVLLHLDRRRSQRLHIFAALRWLGDRHRPRRTWRITEWLLLALRLALLAAAAAWLAHPLIDGNMRQAQRWIAVAPGATTAGLANENADRIVWLSDGFPALDAGAQPAATSTASLLRELDAKLAPDDTLQVRVPREIGGLDAASIALMHAFDWQITDGVSPLAPAPDLVRHTLVLRYDDPANPSLRYVRAAMRAWSESNRFATQIDDGIVGTPIPHDADAVLLLGADPDAQTLAHVSQGARLLQIPATPLATQTIVWPPTFERLDRGARAILAGPLAPDTIDALQSPNFPAELRRTLFADAAPSPARAAAAAMRPLLRAQVAAPTRDTLRPALAWLVAIVFALERILANGRRLARIA